MFAAGRRLPPGPVLEEAARVMRRRGEQAHRALRPGEGEDEADAARAVRSPRRRPSRAGHEAEGAAELRVGPARSWPPFWRWRRFLGLPRGVRDDTP